MTSTVPSVEKNGSSSVLSTSYSSTEKKSLNDILAWMQSKQVSLLYNQLAKMYWEKLQPPSASAYSQWFKDWFLKVFLLASTYYKKDVSKIIHFFMMMESSVKSSQILEWIQPPQKEVTLAYWEKFLNGRFEQMKLYAMRKQQVTTALEPVNDIVARLFSSSGKDTSSTIKTGVDSKDTKGKDEEVVDSRNKKTTSPSSSSISYQIDNRRPCQKCERLCEPSSDLDILAKADDGTATKYYCESCQITFKIR